MGYPECQIKGVAQGGRNAGPALDVLLRQGNSRAGCHGQPRVPDQAGVAEGRRNAGPALEVLLGKATAALAAMGNPECQISWALQKAGGMLDPPLKFFSGKATADQVAEGRRNAGPALEVLGKATAALAAMGNPECQIKWALQKAGGMLDPCRRRNAGPGLEVRRTPARGSKGSEAREMHDQAVQQQEEEADSWFSNFMATLYSDSTAPSRVPAAVAEAIHSRHT